MLRRSLVPAIALSAGIALHGIAQAAVIQEYPLSNTSSVDLNQDGVTDVQFNETLTSLGRFVITHSLEAAGTGSNMVSSGRPLSDGFVIDGTTGWSSSETLYNFNVGRALFGRNALRGAWVERGGLRSGYLGVAFAAENGATHYGWLELAADALGNSQLVSYAWETVAGVGIAAGSTETLAPVPLPASLALFGTAIGGLALVKRRKKKSS
ncbi:VPLPA-CTERM sorting domain-containing protein [Thioclava sp. SK-1]|uniref:VPLPA-CTERM sorting domain-containing protein n=1 Tax=Thioclava sp. SK-1 TaxID=1889770 RepID=UPI00159F0C27|nr:VPLPA-CTERM sorting domain-containing protein [Thioclava sp. SK-1]